MDKSEDLEITFLKTEFFSFRNNLEVQLNYIKENVFNMLNIRLEQELERKLELIRKKKGISKSALVKEALNQYINDETSQLSAFELGKDLFDSVENEVEKKPSNYKSSIKNKLKKKFGGR